MIVLIMEVVRCTVPPWLPRPSPCRGPRRGVVLPRLYTAPGRADWRRASAASSATIYRGGGSAREEGAFTVGCGQRRG